MERDIIYNQDCLVGMRGMPAKSIDLIITDPPYLIERVSGGGFVVDKNNERMFKEIKESKLTNGFSEAILAEMVRVMRNINIYIWCNHKQIPQYMDYFVKGLGCSFDIIIWHKTNAMPLFNNKWLTDIINFGIRRYKVRTFGRYCLYFRKGAYCNPESYNEAKTVFHQPIIVL